MWSRSHCSWQCGAAGRSERFCSTRTKVLNLPAWTGRRSSWPTIWSTRCVGAETVTTTLSLRASSISLSMADEGQEGDSGINDGRTYLLRKLFVSMLIGTGVWFLTSFPCVRPLPQSRRKDRLGIARLVLRLQPCDQMLVTIQYKV